MSTLGQVRDDLALRLSKIGGLDAWARVPDSIEPPVALVGMPEEGLFNVTYSPSYTAWTIPVRLYVSRFDAQVAQEALDEYVGPTGVMSVKRAIEDKTVATSSGWLMVNVSKVSGFGSYSIANVDYLGCEFTVEVIA